MQYELRRSARARYMRLSVQPGGTVVLTAPARIDRTTIEAFLAKHARWIDTAIKKMARRKVVRAPAGGFGRRGYLKYKEEARAFVHERVAHWNRFYQFKHGRIAIKNTKRLWGSCSHKGNLNFSYTLLFLPRELADYVVVHELCHLKEHNHSSRFWALVQKTIPSYRELRAELTTFIRH